MTHQPQNCSKWPEGVPFELTGFNKPLFSILDAAAAEYSDATYTIFNDAERTYSQVLDTADRLANFLVSRGISKGESVAIFLPNILKTFQLVQQINITCVIFGGF